jgi:hypothetical protein
MDMEYYDFYKGAADTKMLIHKLQIQLRNI